LRKRLSAHLREVREAIERHRRGLDRDTIRYLEANNEPLTNAARETAARYMGVSARQVAFADSTTMAMGLVYAGLPLQPGDEILTTEQDYFVTHESVRLACARTGAVERRIALHGERPDAGANAIVARIRAGVTLRTRVIGPAWVHSSTGLKLPLAQISGAVAEMNRGRDKAERILICVDGVHGFGNQDVTLDSLGCDFLASGCHE
jgi:selenocysteine lyase/cysteine desulfurase